MPDSNNALFVSLAIVMVEALFADKIEPDLRGRLKNALHKACLGNAKREIGYFGDNMHVTYSNPWMLRCVCTTFAASWVGDDALLAQAEGWARETEAQFAEYGTPGEFNSPTYAGVTMMALGLAQYCPPSSTMAKIAPGILTQLWESLAEVYNPTLANIAGPWDRTYGYCLTQYYATVGATLASVTGLDGVYPMPKPLIGCEHGSDVALLPLQMIVAPYVEAGLTPDLRERFTTLTPHSYSPQAFSPPHDRRPRNYTFHLSDGLSVGGVSFDEDVLGGPAKNVTQFTPGVIQWDSGRHGGGCGWIAVWPENAACDITATPSSLAVTCKKPVDFPDSPQANQITLHIGCLPFMQLDQRTFDDHAASLPGLDVRLSGNVVERGIQSFSFTKDTNNHGAAFYKLIYAFPASLRNEEDPALVINFVKTKPPVYDLRF